MRHRAPVVMVESFSMTAYAVLITYINYVIRHLVEIINKFVDKSRSLIKIRYNNYIPNRKMILNNHILIGNYYIGYMI